MPILPPDISEREYVLLALKLPHTQIYITHSENAVIRAHKLHKGRLTPEDHAAYRQSVTHVERKTHDDLQRAIAVLEAAGFEVALVW